jgi:Flp pilus assembly protein TadD
MPAEKMMKIRARVLSACVVLSLVGSCASSHPPVASPPPISASLARELAAAEARVAHAPGDAEGHRDLGLLAFFAGDRARALAELSNVVARDPDDARAAWGLALALDVSLDDKAAEVYRGLVAAALRHPDDPWAVAAATRALRWLDDRAVDEGDAAAAESVRAAAASKLPALVEAALDSRHYRQRGETEGLAEWAARRGCVTSWQEEDVSMPAPHMVLLSPTKRLVTRVGDGGEGHDPGLRHGHASAPRCLAVVRPPRSRPARVVLATTVESDAEREIELELRVNDADVLARVWWGDSLVLARNTAHRYLPDRVVARVKVGKGSSRVAVELAALGGPFGVELYARDPATGTRPEGLRFAADPAQRPATAAAPAAQFQAAPPPRLPSSPRFVDGLLVDVLLAERALEAGDSAAAAEATGRLRATAPGWIPGLELEARVTLEAPGQAPALTKDAARRLRTHALDLDPGALRARLALAEQLAGDDDNTGALKVLGAEEKGAPPGGTVKHWRADLIRAGALRDKGLEGEADAAEDRAISARPDACEVRFQEVRKLARLGKQKLLMEAAERLVVCDGWSAVLAAVAQDAGDHARLVSERKRLLARSPEDPSRHVDLGRALLAAGDPAGARASFTTALALDPFDTSPRLALADLDAAQGDLAAARHLLGEGLALTPEARELASALSALGAPDDLAPWRIDGRQVIRAYEADEKAGKHARYQAPGVLVLDRMVVVVHADGSRLSIVHQIAKVQEKAGVEKWGEIQVPEGAELLAARTIKADGSVREPQSLGGKQGLTAPDLGVGDYVESEYYFVSAASAAWDGGFVGDRFYFQNFDEPFDRTEYIVAAPEKYDLQWDVRGESPRPSIEHFDGWEVTTFQKRAQAQLVPEPSGPPAIEWMASVQPYSQVSLAAWRAWVGEQVYGTRRADAAVRALALELAGGKSAPEAARAIHDWVLDSIDDGGALSDEPAQILSRRSGRRVVLMVALCEAAGIPVELWLARPRESGEGTPAEVQIPDLAYPLLRLRLPKGDLFVDPRYRYAPLGYLPPSLRDVPMVQIPDPEAGPMPKLKLYLTPTQNDKPDQRVVVLDVQLGDNGAAVIDATETLSGAPAAQWRDYLKDVPQDEVERDLEQRALGFWFPGATLRSLAIDAKDDPYAPLVLRYRFEAPRYARLGPHGELALPVSPMPRFLQRQFVTIGARQTALVLDGDGEMQARVTVHPPKGFAPARALPKDASLDAPGDTAHFTARLSFDGGALVSKVDSSVKPLGRVAAKDYPAFVRFAGTVDSLEQGMVVLARP